MSEIDEYADPEVYMDDLEEDCDYGVSEFCTNPDLKHMNCCFECEAYLDACEEQDKRFEEERKKAMWPAKEESK